MYMYLYVKKINHAVRVSVCMHGWREDWKDKGMKAMGHLTEEHWLKERKNEIQYSYGRMSEEIQEEKEKQMTWNERQIYMRLNQWNVTNWKEAKPTDNDNKHECENEHK